MDRVHHLLAVGILCAATLALFPRGAEAQTLFFDDFNSDPITSSTLINWNITNGGIDVIGPGFADLYPGNGNYLDMDGSVGDAGRIETKNAFSLTPGNYMLSFSQGKNGGAAEEMTISVGSVFSTLFGSPAGNVPTLVNQEFNFTVASATTGTIVFDHAGGDNQGITVDNVRLARVTTVVPEASTFALALPALAIITLCNRVGTVLVRQRKK